MEYLPYMDFDRYVKDGSDLSRSPRLRGVGGVSSPDGESRRTPEPTAEFPTRSEAAVAISTRMFRLLNTRNEKFATVSSFADLFNSWRNSLPEVDEDYSSKTYGDDNGRRMWTVIRTIRVRTSEGPMIYRATAHGPVLKLASEDAYKTLYKKIFVPCVQMDNVPSKESVQGDATQESAKDSNTIITRDQSVTSSKPEQRETTAKLASSEPTMQFTQLVGRWMPLKVIKVSTTAKLDDILVTYYLPETFLSTMAKCAPNTIPFETFVYGAYDYELKFVVNANKFQCGKVIASVKFDSYQADDIQHGFQAHLGRPHVILDLSANNEGILKIPFRYHRAFVRNLTHKTATVGIRPGKYASVYVSILSPLRTGSGGANDMDIRPFYMIRKAEFAGMSYKVPLTQMDLDSVADALPTKSLKAVLKGVEATLDQLGSSHNQDKPTDLRGMIVVPRPRLQFPSGKGLSDASVLRMNPHALTSFNVVRAYGDEPKTTLDIAKIWGLRSTFTWADSQTEGTELMNTILDPTSRNYAADYSGQPTPLEYICSFYQFWSGPIDLRFDFVSNAFHTGSVIISAEYNRTSAATDECESHSTYTKTFHLGSQKSVNFRVPYIYDTVWRRSTGMIFNGAVEGQATSDAIKSAAITIRPESRMRVKVRVLNSLRPVSSTTKTIDILMFMRASANFAVHALKQSDMREERDVVPIDSFPSDNYAPVVPEPTPTEKTRGKRETVEVKSSGTSYVATAADRYLPAAISNKWNERLPRTQMDSGEKEAEDSTEDFSVGRSALTVQSLDIQVGIKDILRRPVLIFAGQTCLAAETGFFIPLMPPSRMMQYVVGKPTSFVKTIGQTPQAALMNLFRFWRGSMRYTILIHKKTAQPPIYVTHVPHSGVRLFSNKTVNTVADKQLPIYGSGLTTEIIIPQVNPTACIEAPYDTENNWTLTFDEDSLRNYSWRDKGDVVSGHLVLSSANDFVFSVWWHAGDDFEFSNYYGIPKMRSNAWAYQWSDEHARVQMDDGSDFRANNALTSVNALFTGLKAAATPVNLVRAAICSLPGVGTGCGVTMALDKLDTVCSHVTNAATGMESYSREAIDRVVDTFGVTLSGLSELISSSVSKIVGGFGVAANLTAYCYDVVLDILIAWVDKSWTAIGVSVVRFLGKALSGAVIVATLEYGVELGSAIAEFFRPQEVMVQAPPRDRTAALLGILAGLVGTLVGVRVNMYRYTSVLSGVLARLTEAGGMSYLVNVLRFVESTFGIVKETVLGALGYVTPEAAALRMLSASSGVLNTFVSEAQLVTSEANANMLMDPGFRQRLWKTVMQAYQIQKLLVTVPTQSASPVLGKLCYDVIKLGNEKFVDISAAPVRYEPFVICIEGPAGIGKSELVDVLAASLLEQISFERPHSGATYYRMPGSRFWSGYRDQPVVIYDDWLNLTDPTAAAQQLSEIYQLKSTSFFIPEMAHLEEKKIRGNPLVVILLCNHAFPDSVVTNMVSVKEAVYRRRDILLRADKKTEFANVSPRDMTSEQQNEFQHLEFRKYASQTDRTSLSTEAVGYAQASEYVCGLFKRWHAQEQIKVQRRLKRAFAGVTGANIDELRIDDPFALYYSVANRNASDPGESQNAFLPSEILASEVARIAATVQSFQNMPEAEQAVPDAPADCFVPGVQSPWGAVATQIVGTQAFLARALEWSVTTVERWLHSNFRVSTGATVECCVCMDQKLGFAKCPNSTGTNPHVVCQECYALNREHTRGNKCPMCNVGVLEPTSIEDIARAMGVFSLWAARAGMVAADIGNRLLAFFNGRFGFVYSLLYRSVLHFASVSAGVATVSELEEASHVYWLTEAAGMVRNFVVVQLDNPFTGEAESDDLEETEEVFQCQLNEDEVERLMANPVDQAVCGHRWLRGNAHCVEYIDGKFKLLREGGMVMVPEEACYDPCCAFTNEIELRSFYTHYMREHSAVLTSYLRAFYNAGVTNESGQGYYYNRVPRAVRPTWMKLQPALRQELAVLARTTWWDSLSEVYSNYRTLIWSLVGVSAAIGGLMTIHNIFKPSVPQVQYIDSGDDRTRHLRRAVRELQRPSTVRPHFQSMEAETPSLHDVVQRYVARNYVTILIGGGGERRMLTACGLYNRKALIPRHYVKEIRKQFLAGASMTVCPALLPHEAKEYTFDEKDFVLSDVTDLAIWTLPPSFGMFKDIRKFLTTDADLEKAITPEATLILAPCRRVPNLTNMPITLRGIQNSEIVRDVDGEKFTAYDVLVYDYSQPGACGSLVLLSRTTRPIVAMHFAGLGDGKQGEGYGVILTQQSIGEIAHDVTCAAQMEEPELESIDEAKILLGEANVSYMGTVPPERTVFLPRKTKIRPSLVNDRGGLKPLTQPCILDKTDHRYTHDITPLVAGVMKHGKLTKDFRSSVVARARERLWDSYISGLRPAIIKPVKLTYEEAVSGFSSMEYYDPIVLSTSAGYPWCTTAKKRKEDYIGVVRNAYAEIESVTIDEEVVKVLSAKEAQRQQGEVPFTPFVDTLKDERRRPEKLLKLGGTRVFCNPPLDYVIAMRQNFLHFTAAFMSDRFNMQHAVGINVNGTEWTQLARRLIEKSPNNVCTIDYSNFGPGFNAGVAQAAMELMIRWTMEHVEGVDRLELICLLEECLNSQHLCVNTVYYQKCGSPSGAPITTIINTLVNQLLVLIAWDLILGEDLSKGQKLAMEEYKQNVALFCYGDDLIMSVTDAYKEKFNAKTITRLFADYDIVATDASKSETVKPYGLITEASFLKMNFARHERHHHLWQSQLDWVSINDTTQWIWECPDHRAATYENCKAALLSAHGHGSVKFNQFKAVVNRALLGAGCQPVSLSWEEVDDLFYPDVVY